MLRGRSEREEHFDVRVGSKVRARGGCYEIGVVLAFELPQSVKLALPSGNTVTLPLRSIEEVPSQEAEQQRIERHSQVLMEQFDYLMNLQHAENCTCTECDRRRRCEKILMEPFATTIFPKEKNA